MERVRSLAINEHPTLHIWQARAARLLWLALLVVMLAPGLGAFGNGPLSRATAGFAGDPLWVEYDRVARFGASVRLIVHAAPQPDGSVRFTLGRSLLEAFRVQQVMPAPASSTILADGVEFRFETAPAGEATVIFEVQPVVRWTVEGEVRSPGGAVQLSQLVLP